MKKTTAGLLIASGVCIVGGGILTVAGAAAGGKIGMQITADGIRIADETEKRIEESRRIKQTKKLFLDTEGMDICIQRGEEFRVDYSYPENRIKINQEETDDAVRISAKIQEEEQEFSLFWLGSSDDARGKVTLILPKEYTPDVMEITSDTGDCAFIDVSAGQLKTSFDHGEISVEDCTFGEWKCQAYSGTLRGTDLTCESVEMMMEYGNVDVKNLTCTALKADYESGDFNLDLREPLEDYNLKLDTEYGTIYLDGKEVEDSETYDGKTADSREAERAENAENAEDAEDMAEGWDEDAEDAAEEWDEEAEDAAEDWDEDAEDWDVEAEDADDAGNGKRIEKRHENCGKSLDISTVDGEIRISGGFDVTK